MPDVSTALNWNFAPSILMMLLSQAALYGYLVYIARSDGRWGTDVRISHVVCFVLVLSLIFVVLVTPIDSLSNAARFSAHMVQHSCSCCWPLPAWCSEHPAIGFATCMSCLY